MSYGVRDRKYLYEQHYEAGKKVHNYGGIVRGDTIVEPSTDGIEKMIDYELKQAYEHLSKVDLLTRRMDPRTYKFNLDDFEEWKKRQRSIGTTADKTWLLSQLSPQNKTAAAMRAPDNLEDLEKKTDEIRKKMKRRHA